MVSGGKNKQVIGGGDGGKEGQVVGDGEREKRGDNLVLMVNRERTGGDVEIGRS